MSVREQMLALTNRRHQLFERIAKEARPLIAVLKDSGRPASAAPLQEAFFELDALDQELLEFAQNNLEAVLRHVAGLEP